MSPEFRRSPLHLLVNDLVSPQKNTGKNYARDNRITVIVKIMSTNKTVSETIIYLLCSCVIRFAVDRTEPYLEVIVIAIHIRQC